jgi:hypothetical protein
LLTSSLYSIPRVDDAAARLPGLDEAVFLTREASAAEASIILISLVSTGREDERLWTLLSGCAGGGRLIGWLELVLTTLSRVCAAIEPVKLAAAKRMHTENKTNFSDNFKLCTPLRGFGRENLRR